MSLLKGGSVVVQFLTELRKGTPYRDEVQPVSDQKLKVLYRVFLFRAEVSAIDASDHAAELCDIASRDVEVLV